MIGTIIDPADLKQPKTWDNLEVGIAIAVPNRCADYFDLDWTEGRILQIKTLERPSRNGVPAPTSHCAEIQVTDRTSIWITRLDLMRVIPAD